MSRVQIWIHAVWGTKRRKPVLSEEIRKELFTHIKENAKHKEIYIDAINGYTDHIHCLIALNAEMSISKTLQLIKGESAFWANKNRLVLPKLEWADEYYAASISQSHLNKVRNYIRNQAEHHKKLDFTQEYEEFVKENKFVIHG